MVSKDQISIRIVCVDHYMGKPDPQFDTCYSEFRGSEVKQVPVIRLFGSSANGRHSCVHIHGVFPYFYIPYNGTTSDKLAVDKKIYQLAMALDKAINISLGHSQSQTKHIFKIVLVKGMPIYGYHLNEHHYLKIYMYNPLLIRTATQLLMNGTILSMPYQVHETHIPYILQFFIDYNLYGMSFLVLDTRHLKQRMNVAAHEPANGTPKMSTSDYEIDVLASDILNREPKERHKSVEFANPGIASIWKDEQTRRHLLGLEQPAQMNLSQSTGPVKEVITESDRFYRALLLSKLSKKQKSDASTEDQSASLPSAYPSEAAAGEKLIDASYIANHRQGSSNDSLYDSQISYYFDSSTVVDEHKIATMSQNPNATMGEEDYDILEIMRQLEEQETNNFENDCLLAPLTQQHDSAPGSLNLSQANKLLSASMRGDLNIASLNITQIENHVDTLNDYLDSDDEFMLDFTQKQTKEVIDGFMKDLAHLKHYFDDSGDDLLSGGSIPQLDGGDDSLVSTPSKRNREIEEKEKPEDPTMKKMRTDLSHPTTRKTLTPRRVTFALSPTEKNDDRTKRVLKEFEALSPNLLKKMEIRVPKLGVNKKSILFSHKNLFTQQNSPAKNIPLKNLHIRLTKFDHTAYDLHTAPTVFKMTDAPSYDRYQLARDYDLFHNYNPMEGPSRPKNKDVRKKIHPKSQTEPSEAKRLKLEEVQTRHQIEILLSERFKNIVRLSPKVLIKPLLLNEKAAVNYELSLSDYIEQSSVDSSGQEPTNNGNSDLITSEGLLATTTINEDCNQGSMTDPDIMDVEFSLPTSSDSCETEILTQRHEKTYIIDDDSSDDNHRIASEKENNDQVSISDDDSDHSICLSATLLIDETATKERLEKKSDGSDAINNSSTNSQSFGTLKSTVPIGIQLDGVGETSDEISSDEQEPEKRMIDVEEEGVEDVDSQTHIQSFCEKTLVCERDVIFSDTDESCSESRSPEAECRDDADECIMISLQISAPTRDEALQAIDSLEIPAVVNKTPFYGNPADVTGKKEVGHTVLHITGNSLNDVEEFTSSIAGLGSLKHLRYNNLQRTFGDSIDEVLGSAGPKGSSSDRIKELLASEDTIAITPSDLPPNRTEANSWLDNRYRKFPEKQQEPMETDSPIKVRTEHTILSVNEAIESSQSGPSKIDTESSLNLSVLIASEKNATITNGNSTTSLVSKIMSLNTYGVPETSLLSNYNSGAIANEKELGGEMHDKNSSDSVTPDETNDEQSGTESEDIIECSPIAKNSTKDVTHDLPTVEPVEEEHNTQNVQTEKIASSHGIVTSDQSDLIEQSNSTVADNTLGFKVNYENLQDAKSKCEYNYLTILSLELHVKTRGDLLPNPSIDPITTIFYRIHNDVPPNHPRASSICGIIMNNDLGEVNSGNEKDGKISYKYNQSAYEADVVVVTGERELYEKFLMLVSFWDPDIFTGYEIESVSWGYVIERGYALEMNLLKMLSRVPTAGKVHVSEEEQQELLEMHDYSAGLKIPGRILLDIWRLMRHEIALTSYTFENVVYHILHRRIPNHSFEHLTRMWNKSYSRWVVLEYYLERVNGNLEILNQLDLIDRTAELAKLFGIQFYEVLSRGSQFRVESMMLRIAKPRNFVSVSPSIQQRAHMRAPEYLPLIMEPNSRFYADPIIVLDFQSLYPSVIIAYNYCFSTCLGRIEHLGESTMEFEFGASNLRVPPKMVAALLEKNLVTFSPCGVAFVKNSVREGVLPRMLSEILNTRLMVKKSMKLHKDNTVLQRVLHSRQLGLKLIANVTYGYTAANFSGRMPCVEIGDSVVAKGRETLERAIKLVEETERWGAKVVYGDTDSLFVLCPGRTKEAAFKIGEEIAESVTKDNPPPIKLKLEKVYLPSILQTKKRYVGYMYESADQEKPTYEAKGIETVRRDGCPIVAKMLEKVLRILFETCDVSKVKHYVCRQFTKILEGRINLQDFIFAKEFRGEDGYKENACVPALELTRKWKQTDPRREPRRGQRVPYVIINGPPLVPLIRLVRSPYELLANEGLKINSNYYISKAIIPPLNRCLLLIGADVNQWYNDLPRKTLILHNTGGEGFSSKLAAPVTQQKHKKSTITQYFSTTNCITDCGKQTQLGICENCRKQPQRALAYVMSNVNKLERKLELTKKMCGSCSQRTFDTGCISLDCPVVYSLNRCMLECKQAQYFRDLVEEFF
ncbi:DNA polymerase zeta catalytic subunit [Anopheles nili]|uniref:DNA polymerase zeta catalytic subunit n=1 Tax=Anopheles nili TaxID=185578 RepID=UPI00237BDFC6|nr:DNA polymerase zeta catalytic subunit [Anopheles nili]